MLKPVIIATSNHGKLRDFAGAARVHGIEIQGLPNFEAIPECAEDGDTFEANARKKAEYYSRYAPGQIVVADDSGIEADALNLAPGVRSARYASDWNNDQPHTSCNSDDDLNNERLLHELRNVPDAQRTGRFVCVIAAARDAQTFATFRGTAEGVILREFRGEGGFGYDPLFFFPQINKTFAQLTAEEKSKYSHRGEAFRKFLDWYETSGAVLS
jgi:XTP/dITP diphosphohydrolase